jgi:peroxiredoxin
MQSPSHNDSHHALPAGNTAPDFTLHTTPDQTLSLHEFKGRPVILCFYPADWSPVCSDELALFNELIPEFHNYDATFLACSVDGNWSHLAFAKDRHLQFPLLSDFEPKGNVAKTYGVYRYEDGVAERALFVIDENGTIAWSYVSPIGINPGADGILRALDQMKHKGALKNA